MSKRLAQTLIADNVVSATAIEAALQRQVVHGGSLGTNLLESGDIDEETLLSSLSKSNELPGVDKRTIDKIASNIPQAFPKVFAESYHLVPMAVVGNSIAVMVNGQPDQQILDRIHERLGLVAVPAIASEVRLHYAMNALYGTELLPRFRVLLSRLDGNMVVMEPGTGKAGDVLSWGVSSARVQKTARKIDLRDLLARLEVATDRDSVVEVLLGAVLALFDFSALFLVQGDHVNGWRGTVPDETQRIAKVSLPVDTTSVFKTIYTTRGHYLGPLPANEVNTQLLKDMGRTPPRAALLAPVMVGDKLAAILYADNGSRGISSRRVAAVLMLTQRVGVAFERLIRQRKEAAEDAAVTALEPQVHSSAAFQRTTDGATPGTLEFVGIGADVPGAPPRPPRTYVPVVEVPDLTKSTPPAPDAPSHALPGNASVAPALDASVVPALDAPGAEPSQPSAAAGTDAEIELHADDIEITDDEVLLPPVLPSQIVGAGVGDEVSADDDWDAVSFQDIDQSPTASMAAFQDGVTQASDDDLVEIDVDDYVAFEDIEGGDEGALDEWEDVLVDATQHVEDSQLDADVQAPAAISHGLTWAVVAQAAIDARKIQPAGGASVEVSGYTVDTADILFDAMEAQDPEVRRGAIEKLLGFGSNLDSALEKGFPGAIGFDPFASNGRIPPFAKCSGLCELLAARGSGSSPVVYPHLDSPDRTRRFFAIYFFLTVQCPEVLDGLARRLYDQEPRNRHLAADALRIYSRDPGYQNIVSAVRQQLGLESVASQVSGLQVLAQLRDPGAVPQTIPLLVAADENVRYAATSALGVICAQNFGEDTEQWSAWWRGHYNQPRPVWLLEALRSDNVDLRRIANHELQLLTGRTMHFVAESGEAERNDAALRWDDWWQKLSSSSALA